MKANIACPYCGVNTEINNDETLSYEENAIYKQECHKCSKIFIYSVQITIEHAIKADCLNNMPYSGEVNRCFDKRKIIDGLMDMLNNENCNQVKADNGLDALFGKDKLFSAICNKCTSLDIEIIGERGIDWGGQTGHQSGSTAIKCNSCGSSLTVWEQ